MENPETPLPTDLLTDRELCLALGICIACKRCAQEPDDTLCEICRQKQTRRALEAQWAEWGIAA